jgi:hypothetical protein
MYRLVKARGLARCKSFLFILGKISRLLACSSKKDSFDMDQLEAHAPSYVSAKIAAIVLKALEAPLLNSLELGKGGVLPLKDILLNVLDEMR